MYNTNEICTSENNTICMCIYMYIYVYIYIYLYTYSVMFRCAYFIGVVHNSIQLNNFVKECCIHKMTRLHRLEIPNVERISPMVIHQ